MPPRTTLDYEGPSVEPRVQAALSAALAEEDEGISVVAQDNLPGLDSNNGVTFSPDVIKHRSSSKQARKNSNPPPVEQEEFPVARGLLSRSGRKP